MKNEFKTNLKCFWVTVTHKKDINCNPSKSRDWPNCQLFHPPLVSDWVISPHCTPALADNYHTCNLMNHVYCAWLKWHVRSWTCKHTRKKHISKIFRHKMDGFDWAENKMHLLAPWRSRDLTKDVLHASENGRHDNNKNNASSLNSGCAWIFKIIAKTTSFAMI